MKTRLSRLLWPLLCLLAFAIACAAALVDNQPQGHSTVGLEQVWQACFVRAGGSDGAIELHYLDGTGTEISTETLTVGSTTKGLLGLASVHCPNATEGILGVCRTNSILIGMSGTYTNAASANYTTASPSAGIALAVGQPYAWGKVPQGVRGMVATYQAATITNSTITTTNNTSTLNNYTIDTNSGTKGNGTQRVVIATDQPSLSNPQPVSQSGTWNIGSITTLPSLAAGSAAIGSITNTSFGISGTLPAFASTPTVNAAQSGTWTVQPGNTANTTPWLVTAGNGKTIKTASGTLTADTDVIAAVTSKRIKVIAYSIITTDNTGDTILFKSNGTGGTEVGRVYVKGPDASTPYGANLAIAAPSFLFATAAGEKLTFDVSSGATIHYYITYFDDDAS